MDEFNSDHLTGMVIAKMVQGLCYDERLSLTLALMFKLFCDDTQRDPDEYQDSPMKEKDEWIKSLIDDFIFWLDETVRDIFGSELDAFDLWEMDNARGIKVGSPQVISSEDDLENSDIPERMKSKIKRHMEKQAEPRLNNKERRELDEDDFFLHVCDFYRHPIQAGSPTEKDFDYLLKISEQYWNEHSSGIQEEGDPRYQPWLIEPDVFDDFNDMLGGTDIEIGKITPEGLKEVTYYWIPTCEFKEPYGKIWRKAWAKLDHVITEYDDEKLFQHLINEHTDQYLAITGCGPSSLRLTIYEKE